MNVQQSTWSIITGYVSANHLAFMRATNHKQGQYCPFRNKYKATPFPYTEGPIAGSFAKTSLHDWTITWRKRGQYMFKKWPVCDPYVLYMNSTLDCKKMVSLVVRVFFVYSQWNIFMDTIHKTCVYVYLSPSFYYVYTVLCYMCIHEFLCFGSYQKWWNEDD